MNVSRSRGRLRDVVLLVEDRGHLNAPFLPEVKSRGQGAAPHLRWVFDLSQKLIDNVIR